MTASKEIRCFLLEDLELNKFPSLTNSEIHIWQIAADDKYILERTAILSEDEQKTALCHRHEAARRCYQIGHTALRLLLSGYTGAPAESFTFSYNKQKKPFLSNMNNIHFNISHSGDWILLAFACIPVGVDIEYARDSRRTDRIVSRFFHPQEAKVYGTLPKEEQARFFYEHWTAREAALKALGIGLTVETNAFLVQSCGPETGLFRIVGGPAGSERLLLSFVKCPDGYIGCVAYYSNFDM